MMYSENVVNVENVARMMMMMQPTKILTLANIYRKLSVFYRHIWFGGDCGRTLTGNPNLTGALPEELANINSLFEL